MVRQKPSFSNLNCCTGPQLTEYIFGLMDELDEDKLNKFLDWINSRGDSLKEDVLDALNAAIVTAKYMHNNACGPA